MTTALQRVQVLVDMADAVNWPVERGAHKTKIRVPGRGMPVAIPGTPGTERAVLNLEMLLRRCGLHRAYDDLQAQREAERRAKVTQVKTRATKAVTAAQKKAETAGASTMAMLVSKGTANGMTIGYETVTPAMAGELISKANATEGFRQRKVSQTLVDEYALLMKHGRWKEFLPDGIIGVDVDGVLINGQKRMLALIAAGVAVGFVVARNVPRDMFPFFDRAQTRTAAHTFQIDGLPSGPEYQSTIKLAMRYDEMLRGALDPSTWGNWSSIRDPNDEALDFYRRHREIAESVVVGRGLNYGSKLVPAAGAVFHYFSDKAWPERPKDKDRSDPLDAFIERVRSGEHMGKNAPAFVLREWSKDASADKLAVRAKREVHLFLLYRHFAMDMEGRSVPGGRVQWQPTWSMPIPYHPEGDKVAMKNLLR